MKYTSNWKALAKCLNDHSSAKSRRTANYTGGSKTEQHVSTRRRYRLRRKTHTYCGLQRQQGSHRPQTPPRVLPPGKSSPVRPLSCNWYYCAQFIAKPKAACALRFSWAATSSNLAFKCRRFRCLTAGTCPLIRVS